MSVDISILMSAYNAQRTIARSIASLLVQDFSNFELIVVDDGSADNTFKICSSFNDDRIKIFRTENRGITKALNYAYTLSKGKYIARHDSDDYSLINRLSVQFSSLEDDSELMLVGSDCYIEDSRFGLVREFYNYPKSYDNLREALGCFNPIVHGSVMMKRRAFEELGGYNEEYRYVQDYELWCRFLNKFYARNVPDPLYVRSVLPTSTQKSVDKGYIFKKINSVHNLKESGCQRSIESISILPFVCPMNEHNRRIKKTLIGISRKLRENKFPYLTTYLQALLQNPL